MVTEIEMAPVFFIGREEELGLVEDLLTAPWGSRQVLLIHGPGGMGKTRLLREIYQRREEYAQRLEKPLLVTRIIDFDDVSMRLPWSFSQHLAAELGREQFREYLDAQETYARYELLGASSDLLREQDQRGRREFMRGYNRVAEQKRILLLYDTVEKAQDTELWHYLQDAIEEMQNTVLVMAGRALGEIKSNLKHLLGQEAVHFCHLSPFDESEALDYFLHTDVGVEIEPEMKEKLYLLSGGHPIFIALAVEWLRRDMPIDHVTTRPLAELQALDDEELVQARKEFETILVNKILDLTPIDQAVLRMAHVHLRFDDKILQYLLELSDEEAVSLSRALHDFPFIRPRPPDIYTLHDEMRRLVNEHTWPRIDPHGTQRRSVSAKMVSYYDGQLETLDANLAKLRSTWEKAQKDEDTEKAAHVFPQLNKLEQQRTLLEVERFHYLLDVDLEQAFDYFLEAFKEATEAYRFALRETLIGEIQKYMEQLLPEQQYEVNIRRAKYLLDCGEYQAGKELLDMQSEEGLQPGQQVDMHIQLGNLEIRLGNLGAGLEHFEQAVKLSRKHKLEVWLTFALNALGWGHRLIGHFEIALRYYEEALELSMRLEDRKREAWILNNMAFAIAHLGRHRAALNLCDQALKLWREIDFGRGLGAVHEVYGEVYVLSERFAEALRHYRFALDIFEPSDDREWLSRVYAGCGLAYRLAGDLDSAETILEEALDIGLEKDKALILHRLAHVYQERGQIDKAEEHFLKSHDLCDTTLEADLKLNNLSDLAGIALRKGRYGQLEDFAAKFEEYQREWPDVNFPRAEGTLLKSLGDLALSATPEDVNPAWGYYKQAFPLLARYGDLRPYSVQAQLSDLNDLLIAHQVPAQTVKELGTRLRELWRQEGLDSDHPDALRFFLRWQEGEYYG